MRVCSKCKQEQPKTNYYKDRTNSCGTSYQCKSCVAKKDAAKWVQHKERLSAVNKVWRANNQESMKARLYAWRRAHPERTRAIARKSAKKNIIAVLARNSSYYAAEKCATPAWANKFFIVEIYRLAKVRTKVTGFVWHVDHIVPLNGKTVRGLHTEQNLRVIPGIENLRKSNTTWPDMP